MIRLWFTKNKRKLYFSVTIQFYLLDFTPIAAFAIVSCKIAIDVRVSESSHCPLLVLKVHIRLLLGV